MSSYVFYRNDKTVRKSDRACATIRTIMEEHINFSRLFRKYRLKSEFETLAEFSRALSEKGFNYEESIFSHWQKGTRVPQHRIVVLKILEIFIEHKAIVTIDQANAFLASAGLGYLSEAELGKIPIKLQKPVFQAPSDSADFSNRDEIIKRLIDKEELLGKILLIYGPAGVGKTSLAIRLAHLLKDRFTDGVLWYKVEEDNFMEILLSIGKIYGEDISSISNKQVRVTTIRSLLSSKNVLLVLDSAELNDDIFLLVPSSIFCTTIVTSKKNSLGVSLPSVEIPLKPFTEKEVLQLFKHVLGGEYPQKQKKILLKIGKRVGNLPLALDLIARQLLYSDKYLTQLPTLLDQKSSFFKDIYHENKNIYTAIDLGYKNLDVKMKTVLKSAAIFKGKDFSAKSIAYINGVSIAEVNLMLDHLVNLSLVEDSTKNRYRLHPVIQQFVRNRLDYPPSSSLIGIAFIIFIFFVLWWIYLQMFLSKQNLQYEIFGGTYGIIAFFGGVCGVHTSIKWGGVKTLVGKSIFMFSVGLLLQEFGQIVYGYYIYGKNIAVPYPSFGDFGFFGTIPFYTYGVYLLARSSGIKINLKSFKKLIVPLAVPCLMLSIGYLLFLRDYSFDWSNPIKVFLDFGYPLGEAIYISIAIITFILSRGILDGILQSKALLILIALFVQFCSDYMFLYYSSSYYSGSFIDFLYLNAYFLMTLSLLNLKSLLLKTKEV